MKNLISLIKNNEDWLVKRILYYGIKQDYTKYTSTLEEAWRLSISGLSYSIISALQISDNPIEFGPDDKFKDNPISQFALIEAEKHRTRGITLGMFLGLLKYYRQCYIDLIDDLGGENFPKERAKTFIYRCYDAFEITFCSEWKKQSTEDITGELQQKTREITNEKNVYLTVFESIANPIFLLNKNHAIINLNHAAAKMIGDENLPGSTYYNDVYKIIIDDKSNDKNKNQIKGKSIFKLLPWLEKEKQSFYVENFEEAHFDISLIKKDNSKYYSVSLSKMLDISEKYTASILSIIDITKHKITEQKLLEQNERLDLAIKATKFGIWVFDLKNNELSWDKRMYEIFGLPKKSICNYETFNSCLHKDDFDRINKEVEDSIQNKIQFDTDYRVVWPNGEIRYVMAQGRVIYNKNDEPLKMLGVCIDITERKIAEQKILEANELNNKILDTSLVGIIVYNNDGDCIMANESAANIVGTKIEQLLAQNFYKIESWKKCGLLNAAEKCLTLKQAVTIEAHIEPTTFGKNTWLNCKFNHFIRDNNSHLLLIAEDITERKLADQELKEYADTQAVLLREVNHRVKNNLAALIGILHKEQDKAEANDILSYTPLLHDLIGRVQGLLTVHSMLSANSWRPLNCRELCDQVISGVLRSLPDDKQVELDIRGDDVDIDSSQSHHITLVMNELATNSIKHFSSNDEDLKISVDIRISHPDINIEYRDNGKGYNDEIISGNFKGINVGLELIIGIVQQSLGGTVKFGNDNGAVTLIKFERLINE